MRRSLYILVAWLLLASSAWAQQGTAVNPPVGSVWTYLGPTFGASWAPTPFGSGPAPPGDNNWLAKWLPGGGLGSAYSPSNQGNLVGTFIDTTPTPGQWGPHVLHVGTRGVNNNAVFTAEMTNPTPIFAFPTALTGAAKLAAASNGNAVFGIYGLGEIYSNTGTVNAAEFTARNFAGPEVDRGLPPDNSIPNSSRSVKGVTVTCGVVSTLGDCSVGIHIGNESALASEPVYNTGMYIHLYRQYGLFVEAMPSAVQTSAVIKNNGNGVALQLQSTAGANTNAALTVNAVEGLQARISYKGEVALNRLNATGHTAAGPAVSGCGTSPSVSLNATDVSGAIGIGAGATTCTVTFGAAFLVPPACVVSALNNVTNIGLTTLDATHFVIGGSSVAGSVVNYVCLPQGG